jgi:hypothetical protein
VEIRSIGGSIDLAESEVAGVEIRSIGGSIDLTESEVAGVEIRNMGGSINLTEFEFSVVVCGLGRTGELALLLFGTFELVPRLSGRIAGFMEVDVEPGEAAVLLVRLAGCGSIDINVGGVVALSLSLVVSATCTCLTGISLSA